jgi:hypothetical protein
LSAIFCRESQRNPFVFKAASSFLSRESVGITLRCEPGVHFPCSSKLTWDDCAEARPPGAHPTFVWLGRAFDFSRLRRQGC